MSVPPPCALPPFWAVHKAATASTLVAHPITPATSPLSDACLPRTLCAVTCIKPSCPSRRCSTCCVAKGCVFGDVGAPTATAQHQSHPEPVPVPVPVQAQVQVAVQEQAQQKAAAATPPATAPLSPRASQSASGACRVLALVVLAKSRPPSRTPTLQKECSAWLSSLCAYPLPPSSCARGMPSSSPSLPISPTRPPRFAK